MNNTTARCILLIVVLLTLPAQSASAAPPNVVLIVADDLGYGDLPSYGETKIETPRLDQMAREGTRFTDFCVAQPVCTASRAALLSGCYPNRLGLSGALNHTSQTGIHPDEDLLPELLQRKGYATAHFGKWHLGTLPEFFPTRNGFDVWFGLPYSNDNGPLHPTIRGIPALPLYQDDEVVATDPDQSRFTAMFTEKAVEFIHENAKKPFFLYVPHVMPHVPIFASEQFRGQSKLGLYGDVVQEIDWSVGKILDALQDAGVDDRTLVLFLSDNGPFLSYGEHAGSAGRLREGKLTTFEGGVRVPLIARWPGSVPAGRVCDEQITGLDLLPTITALCGAAAPRHRIDGIDLSDSLLGKTSENRREVFAYYSGGELHAVRKGRWKLHFPHDYLTVDGEPGVGGKPANHGKLKPMNIELSGIRGIASRHGYVVESLPLSLYDLSVDPGERHNVAAAHPEVVAELKKLGDEYRRDLGDDLTGIAGAGLRPVGKLSGK
jgi:arylsulfatase A-like enzyme